MRFVVLGDLHYATYSQPEFTAARERVFGALFRQVAALKADVVFAIGDTTNDGTIAELTAQDALAAQAGIKLIRITGNHDCDSLEKAEMADFFLGEQSPLTQQELYASFSYGVVQFILMDTSRVKMGGLNWGGIVSDEQLTWLAAEVEKFNHDPQLKYFVVLGHHPIENTTQRSDEKWMNVENSAAIREVLGKLEGAPGLYICGHNHSNSIAGPDAAGWYYLQAGAPVVCESYRIVTVDERGIKIETVDFDLSEPELRADFETARRNIADYFSLPPLEQVYGSETDRQLFIRR